MFRSSTDAVRVPVKEIIDSNKCYNCDLCEEGGWTTEADVDIHRKKIHRLKLLELLRKGKNMCSICLRQQKNSTSLIKHIKTNHLFTPEDSTHIEREIYICDICDNLFYNKKLLIAHIQHAHVGRNARKHVKVECPKCLKLIPGKYVWFHFLSHDILSVSTCPICLTYSENTERMMEHVKSHCGHYCCDICGYNTNKKDYYNNHILKHRKPALPDANTKDVSKYFLPGFKYNNISIIKISHYFRGIRLSNLIQICVLCRAMCFNKEEMRQHIYGDHAPEREVKPKTHMCACGEVFFNNVLLRHHVFKLEGEHRALEEGEVLEQAKEKSCTMLEMILSTETDVEVECQATNDAESS